MSMVVDIVGKQFRNVLVMVGIFGCGFGEGTLEESLVVVVIMVATYRGFMQDIEFKGQRRSRSLYSRRMFAIVEGQNSLRFDFVEVVVESFGMLVRQCLEWIEVVCKQVEWWNIVQVVVSGLVGVAEDMNV